MHAHTHTHMHTHLNHWNGTDATLTSYTPVTHLWEQYTNMYCSVPRTTIAHFAYNLLTMSFIWHSLSVRITFHGHCVHKKAGTFKLDIRMLEDLLTVQKACQMCWLSRHVAHSSDLLAVLQVPCNSAWPCRWQHHSTLNHTASNPRRLSLQQFKILLFLGMMMQFLCTNWRNQNFLPNRVHPLAINKS